MLQGKRRQLPAAHCRIPTRQRQGHLGVKACSLGVCPERLSVFMGPLCALKRCVLPTWARCTDEPCAQGEGRPRSSTLCGLRGRLTCLPVLPAADGQSVTLCYWASRTGCPLEQCFLSRVLSLEGPAACGAARLGSQLWRLPPLPPPVSPLLPGCRSLV